MEKENLPVQQTAARQSMPRETLSQWPKVLTIWSVLLCVFLLGSVWLYRGRYRYEKQGEMLTRVNLFTGAVDWLQPVPNPAFRPVPQSVLDAAVANTLWAQYKQYKDTLDANACDFIFEHDGKFYSMAGSNFDNCAREIATIQWNRQHNNGIRKTVMKWVRTAQ